MEQALNQKTGSGLFALIGLEVGTFDDPKMLSMILHEKEWAGITSLGLDMITQQRSAAASLGLDMIKEQSSAAASIAADMFAVRSAATSVQISDALAAATLANMSLAEMIHGAGGTVYWNELAGGVSRDWLREMDLAGTKMMAAATGVALKSHLINIADLSSQAEALVSSLLPDRLGLPLSISDEAKITLTGSFVDFSHSYQNLWQSLQSSPASMLSFSPALSRLPTVEYYNGAILTKRLAGKHETERN